MHRLQTSQRNLSQLKRRDPQSEHEGVPPLQLDRGHAESNLVAAEQLGSIPFQEGAHVLACVHVHTEP